MSVTTAPRPPAEPTGKPGSGGPPKRRRRNAALMGRAPASTPGSLWNYLFLSLVILFSAFPLYWMLVIATGTDADLAKIPPQMLPGGQLLTNLNEVFTLEDVYFAQSLVNSFIVSSIVTFSVLFFCSLAGFAFAKLRFKGRNVLMVVVVLTLTVPNQLGVVALYILMGELGCSTCGSSSWRQCRTS
jgi:cellobiose transport system permease protein